VISPTWEVTSLVSTDAGMFGVWQPERFAAVTSLDDWEDEVADNASLVRHIEEGAFVPINIGADGAFRVAVRGGQELQGLNDREERHKLVSSELYLLQSRGEIVLGGLEAVGHYTGVEPTRIPLPAGRYSVAVHLIDWMAEPGSTLPTGDPTENALPDFVVQITEESGVFSYRTRVETFDRD
jgi:hypothetical protein